MYRLPTEVMRQVAAYCDDASCVSLSRTCDLFYQDLRDESLIRRLRLIHHHLTVLRKNIMQAMGNRFPPESMVDGAVDCAERMAPVDPLDQEVVRELYSRIRLITSTGHSRNERAVYEVNLWRALLNLLIVRNQESRKYVLQKFCRELVFTSFSNPEFMAGQLAHVLVFLVGDSGLVHNWKLYRIPMLRRPELTDADREELLKWMKADKEEMELSSRVRWLALGM